MNKGARRVALLSRPGAARDRMREALESAGADLVLEADPVSSDQSTVLAAQPQSVLIVLDAATDEALERFDGVLADPSIEVLFEEAELAIGRVGWDAARWVRHLRAKLGLADTVLPPGHPAERAAEENSAPPATPPGPPPLPPAVPAAVPPPLPPVAPRMEFSLADIEGAPRGDAVPAATVPAAAVPPQAAAVPAPSDPARFSFANMSLVDIDADGASDADPQPFAASAPPSAPASGIQPTGEATGALRIEGLEFEEDHPADASRFQSDMDDLNSRIAALELPEERAAATPRGAVLVMAGIGGPDAVRQLLSALPEGFPRAVLIQQRLDGGHYDKLVAQMQRATVLPVKLAAYGVALEPATVYILPPTLGLHANAQGLAFDDADAGLLSALPANDSAVLMLSGADPALVDAVMKLAAAGAFVAGQALDGCYDVSAPAALAARGGVAGKPTELARRLADRWH